MGLNLFLFFIYDIFPLAFGESWEIDSPSFFIPKLPLPNASAIVTNTFDSSAQPHKIRMRQNLTLSEGLLRIRISSIYLHVTTICSSYGPCPSTCPPFLSTQRIVRLCMSRIAFRINPGCCRKLSNSTIILWRNTSMF